MRRAAGTLLLVTLVCLPAAVDSADHRILVSTGIPDHAYGPFPGRGNPNRVQQQDYQFRIPMAPRDADRAAPLPMGPIAVALNGIPFYNPYNAEGRNAVEDPSLRYSMPAPAIPIRADAIIIIRCRIACCSSGRSL